MSVRSKPSGTTQLQAPEDEVSELADLRQLVETLRRSVRARDDFIAIAAHELRNPMTPIVGAAELALISARKAEGKCPPHVILLLERLQDLVQDYVRRATKLLDVSRLEAGNFQLKPAITDLSNLVLSIVSGYEAEANYQHCVLEHDIEAGVGGVFDPLAVEQVIDNLVSNALKFGAGKPVTVRLRSDGRFVSLDVQDGGIGMSVDQQARIFGRFRADRGPSPRKRLRSRPVDRQSFGRSHGWPDHRIEQPGRGIDLHRNLASGARRQRADRR